MFKITQEALRLVPPTRGVLSNEAKHYCTLPGRYSEEGEESLKRLKLLKDKIVDGKLRHVAPQTNQEIVERIETEILIAQKRLEKPKEN